MASVQNPHLARLLRLFFDDPAFRRGFDGAPAALKLHHACAHGLLQHTLEVTDLAAAVADVQATWGYAPVCRDLIVAGALLHDLGKVYELASDGSAYTRRGQFFGHVAIGFQAVSKKINVLPGFPADLADALLHVVLSHHGKEEYGSPVAPLFAEAQIVHAADALDAQLFYVDEARAEAEGDSGWHRALEGRAQTGGRRVFAGAWDFGDEAEAAAPAPLRVSLPVFRLASGEGVPAFATRRLPLRGRTAAGPPILADECVEGYCEVEAEGLPADPALFLLRVDGASMTGDGIGDGNLVVVRAQDWHEPSDVVVGLNLEDDTVTIKRVARTDSGGLTLLSSNPLFPPLPVADPERFRVRGRVVGVVHGEDVSQA